MHHLPALLTRGFLLLVCKSTYVGYYLLMISILLSVKKQNESAGAYPSYCPVDVRPGGFFDEQRHSYILSISGIRYTDEIKRKLCSEIHVIKDGVVVTTGRRKYQFSDEIFASLFAKNTHITLTAREAFGSTTDMQPGSIDAKLTTNINSPVLMALNI